MMIRYFCWYGGKFRVVNEILSLVPDYITSWYEACCGSAAVTLNKGRHPVEVLNDLDWELVNLFTLMADRRDGANLLDRLLTLQHDKEVFMKAKRAQQKGFKGLTPISIAEMSYILISQSFNANRKSYVNGASQRDYRYGLEKNLPLVYQRLEGVCIKSMDAVELVDQVRNDPNAFVLLDVPYLPELRSPGALDVYGHEMSPQDHHQMLDVIRDCKCCIMLCGYRKKDGSDLYDKYLLGHGWKHYKLADLAKTCQVKQKRDVAEEWVWLNYEPPVWSKYIINLNSSNW